MPEMKVGDVIGVECIVQPGPFSDERLITFDTTDGPISGFVQEAELRQVGKTWLVRAVIMAVRDDFLEVRVRGSFFYDQRTGKHTETSRRGGLIQPCMILSQPEIRAEVEKGQIRFDPPLEERQWHEASVDLRLGFKFTKLTAKRGLKVSLAHGMPAIVGTGLWKEKVLKAEDELGKKETYTLDPEEFVLAQTYERIWIPRYLIAMVEGRSSYARAGLSMHQTAPWLQPGWNGQITLEIRNSGPFLIELTPTEDMPCQVTFFQLTSELAETVAYGARPTDVFQGQASPLPPTIDQHL